MLLCDGCDKGYHCQCLNPPLQNIPEGEWYCTPCARARNLANSERKKRRNEASASALYESDDEDEFEVKNEPSRPSLARTRSNTARRPIARTNLIERVRRAVNNSRSVAISSATTSNTVNRPRKRKLTTRRKRRVKRRRRTVKKKIVVKKEPTSKKTAAVLKKYSTLKKNSKKRVVTRKRKVKRRKIKRRRITRKANPASTTPTVQSRIIEKANSLFSKVQPESFFVTQREEFVKREDDDAKNVETNDKK